MRELTKNERYTLIHIVSRIERQFLLRELTPRLQMSVEEATLVKDVLNEAISDDILINEIE